MASSCPISLQLKLEDKKIPFADDAEGSCDGSISSVGTGSVLGHSSSEDDLLQSKEDNMSKHWQFIENPSNTMFLGDQHSLNNILDSVSTQVQSVDIDSLSLENLCMKESPSIDDLSSNSISLKKESSILSERVMEVERNVETSYVCPRPVRPTSLHLQKDAKNLQSFTTLTSAYETLSEQLSDSGHYDSIYSGGYGSPTSTKSSGISTSNPSIAHHYISSFRASMRGSPAPADRDPVARFQNLLKQRYRQLADDRAAVSWCPDFQPAVRQMIFSLARDSSWEKGGHMPKMGPNLRRIPLHAVLADDRRSTGTKQSSGQRILVMGESSYGKTTLILRLLYDWSTQESGGYLGHWKLVFFLPCRDYAVHRNIFGLSKEELDSAMAMTAEMESQTLFLLDGLDETQEWPNEIVNLLEGKLYPSSAVLATSRPIPSVVGHPAFNKRIVIHGLELRHVETFIRSYFGASTEGCDGMIRLVHANARLMKLASNPLMCILLCLTFEEEKGRLPDSGADLFALLMRFVMSRSLKQSQGNMTTQQRKILLDFGRLSLQGIKANRYTHTDAEIKSACQNMDIVKWGFLLRGQVFNKGQKRSFFQPIHAAWSEYVAALYLASVSHYANILQREIFSLPLDAEPCLLTSAGIHRSALQVLFFLCSILSKKSYLFFNILSSFDFPARTLLSFLQTAGLSNVNVAAICKLIQGHVTLATSAALELPSWSALLEHPNCQLQSLAVQYDSKDNLHVSNLIDAMNRNSSIVSLKITAVIGQGLESYRLMELSDHLRSIMAKPKLQTLELSVTSLDESCQGPEMFQPLVDSLCDSLAGTSIAKLALDVDLSSTQILELCTAVSCSSVQVLHLLHLSVEWSGFQALAALVNKRQMTGLDLSGCWSGTPLSQESKSPYGTCHYMSSSPQPFQNGRSNNPSITITATDSKSTPISSPIAGTLSGASVTSSPTSTPVSSARTSVYLAIPTTPQKDDEEDERKQFLSLPRRTRGSRGYSSLNRGLTATSYLSRSDEKRRSDSMLFQKVLLPLPACDRSSHTHSGFHTIFDALRNPSCGLTQLNLSKCSLSVADSMCLGESIRKNRTLVSLRLEGLSGIKEVLPVVLALAENTTLQLLDVSSNHVLVNDSAFQLLCRAMSRNSTLQSLRLCNWTFCLEEEDTFKSLSDAVQATRLRELALTGCLVRIPFQDKRSRLSSALLGPIVVDDLVALLSKEGFQIRSDWLAFLKLDNCRLEFSSKLTLRGPHLICFTMGFQRLNELNLALDSAYAGEPLRDKGTVAFFATLAGHCAQLRTLVLHNWRFHWNKPDKVLKGVSKSLKGLSWSCVSMDGVVLHADNSPTKETTLATMFISVLTNLSTLSLNYWKFREDDAVELGKCIRDKLNGNAIELALKNVPPQTIRLIIRTAEESGKINATYSAGNVYRFKKTGKIPSFLDKMMCITMWKE